MRMMGFGREDGGKNAHIPVSAAEKEQTPVKSLVRVEFEDEGYKLTYFNDRFTLREGDRVFVSGKLSGMVGVVCSVTTRFRVKLSDYERVIALAQTPIRGTYQPKADKMLSYSADAMTPEAFRTWVLPPEEPSDDPNAEVLYGDGYVIPLNDPHNAEDVDHAVFERALSYCRSGRIGYISVKDGVGRAYVKGDSWYELEFCIRNSTIEEAYCGCPYAGLCKHLLAVAITLSVMSERGDLDLSRDFVLIDANRFYEMIRQNDQTVTL